MALFAIMVLTFFDVSGRKIWSQSITGSLELTELLMVVVIFLFPNVVIQEKKVVYEDSPLQLEIPTEGYGNDFGPSGNQPFTPQFSN